MRFIDGLKHELENQLPKVHLVNRNELKQAELF